jgi:cyclopropane-fatty-acyl-phospholipid synthase
VSTEPLRDALAEALPDRPFTVRFWDGAELASTNGAGSPTFTVRSPLALGHVLRSPGQLGIGRAYVAGALDVDDIDATLALLDGYDPPPVDVRTKARLAAAAVRAGGLTAGIPRVTAAELRPQGRRHSIERDRRSVRHHYDVSNAYFALFLDASMTYSCAIWSRGAETLEDAQRTKLELVCQKLALQPGERVLDVGCGAGRTSLDAARAGGHVLGVDVSERMLERARQRAAGSAEFVLGDAQTHPFEPASFDVVISRCGLMFFADPGAAFRNIASALRPGGRLVGLIWQRYEDNEWATALNVSREPFSLGDPEATRELLERAGFRDVSFEDVREPVFYGDDVDAAFAWASWFAPLAEDELRELLAAHSTRDGVLFDSRAWIVSATSA